MRDLDKIREKVVIKLDNGQVALVVLGCLAVSAAVFASGVVVGQRIGGEDQLSISEWTGHADDRADLNQPKRGKRNLAMANLSPDTSEADTRLAQTGALLTTPNPTDAARIEAHRQLAQLRVQNNARTLNATTPPVTPRLAPPVPVTPRAEGAASAAVDALENKYALQVSTLSRQSDASVVVDSLRARGHEARVRPLASTVGRDLYRVEVGQFANARSASQYQKRFELKSGYTTMVVAIP